MALAERPKVAAFMISNCYSASSQRLRYIHELRKFITVDGYGKCGENKCKEKGNGIFNNEYIYVCIC